MVETAQTESLIDWPVETVAIETLKPHPRNYKKHPREQLAHIQASIREHGFYRNVVIANDGTILAGHGVVEACREMQLSEVPVKRLPIAPDSEAALKILAGDNEIALLAEVDDTVLADVLKDIQKLGGLLGTGYDETMLAKLVAGPSMEIETWPIGRLREYEHNPRRNEQAVERMCESIREFGFKIPVLARSTGEVVDGHLRLKAARKLGMTELPVIVCDEWTDAQVKAFRLMVNRSATWAAWDDELLAAELKQIAAMGYDLAHTGFAVSEIDTLLATAPEDEPAPPPPVTPVSRPGDLWQLGPHRIICGDATDANVVARLLEDRKPVLMVTDPPYGIELDSEWRDRAGLNGGPNGLLGRPKTSNMQAEPSYMKHRTEGHTETKISGDTRADWSEAFALVPSLQVAYVWHASKFTREVLDGLLRIGFEYHQQIIWFKPTFVITRTLYWFQHEPCWFVRKPNAPWYGVRGAQSTSVWQAASPKMIMGGSDEEKYDHPTQKPIELMRRPIANHLERGEVVYEPFLGSGTTLAAAEATGRACCGIELDPKYVDVVILRWQKMSGQTAMLGGRTFADLREERLGK